MAERQRVQYLYPTNVPDCVEMLHHYGERARVIAGGTDLLLLMERQGFHPKTLIDITRIPALLSLDVDAEHAEIGSAVTFRRLLDCRTLREGVPFLTDAIRQIGGTQIRNIATLAGNIVNASPAGDTLPPLYVLGAQVHVQGPGGVRRMPIGEFVRGVRQVDLAPGELVTRVSFDLPGPGWRGVFQKLGLRRAVAIAVVSVAALLCFDGERVIKARLALGAVASTVLRVGEAEELLVGSRLDADVIERAAAAASAAARPIDDVRASALYRRHAVRGLVRRTLADLASSVRVGA